MATAAKKVKPKLKYKVPKTLGAAIDLFAKVQAGRQLLTQKAEAEKEQENLLEEAIFKMFKKSELEGAKGKLGVAGIHKSDVPTTKTWPKVFAYIKKTGDFDLLQKRFSIEAVRERWAAGKKIPGVDVFTKVSLRISKRKK